MRAIKDDEILCDLGLSDLSIIQPKEGFKFGTDSVLLSDFASPRRGQRIADLGSGTGIIGFLLIGRQREIRVDALEIDAAMVERCRRSISFNALEDRFTVRCGNIKNIKEYFPHSAYHMVVSNPPYFTQIHARTVKEPEKTARTEQGCEFGDIAKAAKYLLDTGGKFVTMCPAQRLFDMATAMRDNDFCIKKIRFVKSFAHKAPYLVLIWAQLYAREGLIVMPDLIVYESLNVYSDELKKIYHLEEQA